MKSQSMTAAASPFGVDVTPDRMPENGTVGTRIADGNSAGLTPRRVPPGVEGLVEVRQVAEKPVPQPSEIPLVVR